MMPVVLHDQKNQVVPHFDHHNLRTAVAPLMMLSVSNITAMAMASGDGDVGANGSHHQK